MILPFIFSFLLYIPSIGSKSKHLIQPVRAEEQRGAAPIFSVDDPCRLNFGETLEEKTAINYIQSRFKGPYMKHSDSLFKGELHVNSQVVIEYKNCNGLEQPAIILKEDSFQEHLYFSGIYSIRATYAKKEDDTLSKILTIKYKEGCDATNSSPNNGTYQFLIREDHPNELLKVSRNLCLVAEKYRKGKKEAEKRKEVKEEKKKEKESPPTQQKLFTLSLEEQKAICENGLVEGKEVKYVGEISFSQDRVYDPKSKYAQGEEELISGLQKVLEKENDYKAILFCGNASALPASLCLSKKRKDSCNAELCWKRAYYASTYLNEKEQLKDKLKQINPVLYIAGTALNERSARIYLITNKK